MIRPACQHQKCRPDLVAAASSWGCPIYISAAEYQAQDWPTKAWGWDPPGGGTRTQRHRAFNFSLRPAGSSPRLRKDGLTTLEPMQGQPVTLCGAIARSRQTNRIKAHVCQDAPNPLHRQRSLLDRGSNVQELSERGEGRAHHFKGKLPNCRGGRQHEFG